MTDKTAAGITLPYKFVPREYQYPFLRYFDTVETRQRAFLLCHRRAGKDVLAWNNLIRMTQRRVGTYWHCLPQLNQARKVIWNGRTKDGISFMDFIPPQLIRSKRDDDMTIRLSNGSMIQLVGADHIDSLVGTNPIGINFSEFALMKPSVWTFLSPILNENDGWAVFVTTPRSTNHAFDMFKSMVQGTKEGKPYFVQVLTVEDTRRALLDKEGEPMLDSKGNKILVPVIPPEAIQEQRDLNVPEEMIQQEYMCSFESGLVGSYYGAAMRKLEEEGKTKPNPKLWNKKLPVYTSWDLGISDAMAIWYFQYTDAGEINVIEYNEFTEKSLAECACLVRADFKPLREDFGWSDDLIQKAMAQFGHHADYQYASRAFGPHDLAQRDVATGVTRKQVAKKYGINFRAVPKANVAEGIDLVRRMLLKVTFDGDKCLTGIRAMKEYHKEFNEKTQMYDEKPCHDWSSHGCLVAGTKVSTTEGDKNIEDIREGEFILLEDTPAKVLKAGKVKDSKTLVITLSTGEQIECTPDHGIFTHRGVVPADELCYNDIVTTKEDKAWIHLLKNTTKLRDEVLFATKVLNTGFGKREGSLFHRLVESRLCYIKCCIGLGIAPKKLIPWMEILEILIQVTGQIEKEEQVESQAQTENIESGLEKDFIKRTMATGGVRSTVRHTGIFGNKLTEIYQRAITFIIKMVIKTITALRTWSLSVPASTLVCTLLQISGLIVKKTNSKSAELGRKQRNGMPVQKEENGTQSTESRHGLIKLLLEKLALYVEKNMKHIFLAGLNSVEAPAKHVIDVKCSEKVKPVYDLTVENHHCYYANNILVSNCDSFRYLCQGIVAFIDSQAAKASKLQPEADHDYNPLREKAIKMELREMQKLKKRKEGEQQRGLPLFAKCDYNIYDY